MERSLTRAFLPAAAITGLFVLWAMPTAALLITPIVAGFAWAFIAMLMWVLDTR